MSVSVLHHVQNGMLITNYSTKYALISYTIMT